MRNRILSVEESRNRRYQTDVSFRNSRDSAMPGHGPSSDVSALVGRVALDQKYPVIGKDFYIGPSSITGDVRVVSWAAAAAQLFYQRGSDHPLAAAVVATRTFESRMERLVAYSDSCTEQDADALFPTRTSVPALAPPGQRAGGHRSSFAGTAHPNAPVNQPASSDAGRADHPAATVPRPAATATEGRPAPSTTELTFRAADLVRRSLEQPRTTRLQPLLATLQSDQYRAVTAELDQTQIFHGHPGTGKTVVGTHRAAWLVNPERDGTALNSVLYVCPTQRHVEHVSGVLSGLGVSEKVTAQSTATLWGHRVDRETLEGVGECDPRDDSWSTWLLLERSAPSLRTVAPGQPLPDRLQAAYGSLRSGTLTSEPTDPGARHWLSALPEWEEAIASRNHRPLLAGLSVLLDRPNRRFEHIIVDEAQDISPLEWALLSFFRQNADTRWTIVGDLNQRRTNHTAADWDAIVTCLRHLDPAFTEQRQEFRHGYRSTGPILALAAHLLPQDERESHGSLQQDGEPPRIIKARSNRQLIESAVEAAAERSLQDEDRLTAIISPTPELVTDLLQQERWVLREKTWTKTVQGGTARLHVLEPLQARGVEFDHVIVVEPAAFPDPAVAPGLLYTSLTRANRTLTIVHYRTLPPALKEATKPLVTVA